MATVDLGLNSLFLGKYVQSSPKLVLSAAYFLYLRVFLSFAAAWVGANFEIFSVTPAIHHLLDLSLLYSGSSVWKKFWQLTEVHNRALKAVEVYSKANRQVADNNSFTPFAVRAPSL